MNNKTMDKDIANPIQREHDLGFGVQEFHGNREQRHRKKHQGERRPNGQFRPSGQFQLAGIVHAFNPCFQGWQQGELGGGNVRQD